MPRRWWRSPVAWVAGFGNKLYTAVMSKKFIEAQRNPGANYSRPLAVIADPDLTQDEKRKILEAWKAEAVHLEESSGEGFGGGERSNLDEIAEALRHV